MSDNVERWLIIAVNTYTYGGPLPDGAILHGEKPLEWGKKGDHA